MGTYSGPRIVKALRGGVLGRWVIEFASECQRSTTESRPTTENDGAGAGEEMPTYVRWPETARPGSRRQKGVRTGTRRKGPISQRANKPRAGRGLADAGGSMKKPFRRSWLQAGLGAPVDAHPPESPLCSSGTTLHLGSFVALERA